MLTALPMVFNISIDDVPVNNESCKDHKNNNYEALEEVDREGKVQKGLNEGDRSWNRPESERAEERSLMSICQILIRERSIQLVQRRRNSFDYYLDF